MGQESARQQEEGKSRLLVVKDKILRTALDLGSDESVPENWMTYVDDMFGALGVKWVRSEVTIEPPKHYDDRYFVIPHRFAVVPQKFRVHTHRDLSLLKTDKFGDNGDLLVGKSDEKDGLYELIAVSGIVYSRDDEELDVLRGFVWQLDSSWESFNHIYDTERSGDLHGVERRFRFDVPLSKGNIREPGAAVKRLLAINAAYDTYVGYQKERDGEIADTVDGLVDQVCASQ